MNRLDAAIQRLDGALDRLELSIARLPVQDAGNDALQQELEAERDRNRQLNTVTDDVHARLGGVIDRLESMLDH